MLTATRHCGTVESAGSTARSRGNTLTRPGRSYFAIGGAALPVALFALLLSPALATPPLLHDLADPGSDAPEATAPRVAAFKNARTYSEALLLWQSPEDVNAWIGARFAYDTSRAMELSETQRNRTWAIAIHPPHELFVSPTGVCVDLSRFAVETLRQIDPGTTPRYLMVEFAPVTVAGNTLRLHWLASFMRGGKHYFFADSKRPGHIAGPYARPDDFIRDYASYVGRQIISFRELESYQRKQRTLAAKEILAH